MTETKTQPGPVTQLPKAAPTENQLVGTADFLFQPGAMAALEHFAVQMSKGKATLPKHLQGSPADCMAVVMQAVQWRMNPFAVAQKTHLVNGTLGYEAQLVNAVVSSSKAIAGRFKYEWQGEGEKLECRAGAVLAGEKVVTWGAWVKAADQVVKNSPLWKTDPGQQLAYLAVQRWAGLYTPDVILGVYTPDELEAAEIDMGDAQVVQDPPPSRSASVKAKVKAKQAEVIDTTTGEVIDAEPMTYDELVHALGCCESADRARTLLGIGRQMFKQLTEKQQSTLADLMQALKEEYPDADAMAQPE